MYNPYKKLTARLLLFSLLLESCYNPNIGMGKKALPAPEDPAYKQRQYEEEPYICPNQDNTDHPGYVYVGRGSIQEKPHPQLLSSPAARQVAPPSQVGLAQQQATTQHQPKELGSPWQAIGGPRSQDQLRATPARARSKTLSTPSSESSRQRVAKKQAISPQQAPSKRTTFLRNQNELLHSQRAAQAKREERAPIEKPRNELAQPAQPSQAIIPLLPIVTQPPSLADKAPQGIARQVFLAQGGHQVRFVHQDGQWQARVMERIGEFYRVMMLPVVCEDYRDVEKALAYLQEKPTKYTQRRIHVLPAVPPYLSMVYLGGQGLLGGMRNSDPSGSKDEPSKAVQHFTRSHAVPRGLELTESKGASQLERDQQEAARLKEEIAKLYSKLPQATQEADSKVVHELTARLARLLELEGLCAPAQGSDGAKEYIARLRKEHRSSWGQTTYGTEVSKQLTALLGQAYGQELKRVASERLVNKGSIAKVLDQLAALDQEQGEETGELAYYTDAAILYQNVLSVCEEEMKKVESKREEALGYQEQIDAAYSGLAKIREGMLARVKGGKAGVVAQGGMSIAKLQEEIKRDKQVLQDLRADAKTRVAQLEAALINRGNKEEVLAGEKEYIEGSRELFSDIAKGFREFLGRLYQESEQALGPAPCKYSVMGLGSMAFEEMTPYSELEFAILMEEAKDETGEKEYKAYLRQLTHLVHLRVINLQETRIPISKYGISLEDLSKRGVNFDLGGRTPLGRKDKPYDLIQPVAGMMDYLRNQGDRIDHIDKLLPLILESTCYVQGDEELYKGYASEKRVFLREGETESGFPVYKARALKKLLEGVVELEYSNRGEAKSKPPEQGELADFKSQFGYHDAGRLYDVKQEIYRLPDRLLYSLAMYYGILPESGWDAVEKLASRGIIGVGSGAKEASHHLQYTVSFARMLRLRTYLHHDQQSEGVTVLSGVSQEETQQEVSKVFSLPPGALQAGGSLFRYYYTALPLHRKMEAFFEAREGKFSPSKEAGFFQGEAFYDASDHVKGNIYLRLLQYEEAKACYEWALAMAEQAYGPEHPEVASILNNLGLAWNQLGKCKQAISYYERALAIFQQAYGPEHPHVASILSNLGTGCYQLGDPEQAIGYYERALAIYKKAYGPENPGVASILNNLGLVWNQLGNPKQAIGYYEPALAIYKKAYGPENPQVATNLHNLGLAWNQLGDPKQAISYYERALAIYEQAYGPKHPHVATSLNNLGDVWNQLGDSKQAISYHKRALAIAEQVYSREHSHVATSLNSLGLAWNQLGKSKQAIECFKRALDIDEQVYGPEHPNVATILNNLASAWKQLGEPKQAIGYLERALAIDKKAYGPEHPHVATSLNNLGGAWDKLGKSKQAIECLERALTIDEKVYGPEHPNVATILNNLGSAWKRLEEPKQAIGCLERALAIDKKAYGPEHPHVATSLNNLGGAWDKLGKSKQAIECFKRALTIDEKVYGPEHPEVATILNNLGGAWDKLGKSNQAIECFKRALDIKEQVYGPDHPHVATSLSSLGLAWDHLGDPKQAISYHERALAIHEQAYGPDHPKVATSLNNLGSAWKQLGESKQAIGYLERALAIHEQAYGPDHPHVATSLNHLGGAWYQLGDPKQAIECFKRALAIDKKAYGLEHPHVATSLNNLGGAWYQLGDPRQAVSYLERALAIYEKAYTPDHPQVATNLNNLGGAWNQLGDPRQAVSYLERALAIIEKAYAPDHPDVATIFNNLGLAWNKLGDSKQAISYYERAYHIMKKVYGEDHPSTQTIKCNMDHLSSRLENNLEHQVDLFIQACVAGNEDPVASMPISSLSKDLYDDQGNALIAWMAQHEMGTTLEQVLKLGWNPNLPNTSQVYPLHYGAMKNPGLTRRLLQAGAHPFVQTPKGNTPAQVARSKGKVATLAVLLPPLEGISFKDIAAFEETYQAYKQRFSTRHQDAEELLTALELALQVGDADLTQAIQAKQASQNLLGQLIDQYPLATDAIQARFESILR